MVSCMVASRSASLVVIDNLMNAKLYKNKGQAQPSASELFGQQVTLQQSMTRKELHCLVMCGSQISGSQSVICSIILDNFTSYWGLCSLCMFTLTKYRQQGSNSVTLTYTLVFDLAFCKMSIKKLEI